VAPIDASDLNKYGGDTNMAAMQHAVTVHAHQILGVPRFEAIIEYTLTNGQRQRMGISMQTQAAAEQEAQRIRYRLQHLANPLQNSLQLSELVWDSPQ
jgi:hypothetical protein